MENFSDKLCSSVPDHHPGESHTVRLLRRFSPRIRLYPCRHRAPGTISPFCYCRVKVLCVQNSGHVFQVRDKVSTWWVLWTALMRIALPRVCVDILFAVLLGTVTRWHRSRPWEISAPLRTGNSNGFPRDSAVGIVASKTRDGPRQPVLSKPRG